MKNIRIILSSMLLLLSPSIFAANSSCPTYQEIKNLVFIKAVPENFAWHAYSEPFIFNKEKWNIKLSFVQTEDEIIEPVQAIKEAQRYLNEIKSLNGHYSKQDNISICNYMTNRFVVYLKAYTPPQFN